MPERRSTILRSTPTGRINGRVHPVLLLRKILKLELPPGSSRLPLRSSISSRPFCLHSILKRTFSVFFFCQNLSRQHEQLIRTTTDAQDGRHREKGREKFRRRHFRLAGSSPRQRRRAQETLPSHSRKSNCNTLTQVLGTYVFCFETADRRRICNGTRCLEPRHCRQTQRHRPPRKRQRSLGGC